MDDTAEGPAEPIWPAVLVVTALASLPYLSLIAANIGEGLDLAFVLRWWAITVAAGVAVVVLVARRSRGTARWIGAVLSVALFLFFNYPAVVDVRDRVGAPLTGLQSWLLVAAVVVALATPLLRREKAQLFLAIWAPALLLLPLVQLLTAAPTAVAEETIVREPADAAFERHPNVYWFVLDGLAGPPFLRQVGVETDGFVGALEERGFHVQEQARSNYPFTHLAVASALDMEYLYEGVEEPGAGAFFERLQGDNRTVATLRANGYGYVHAYPGLWTGSRCVGLEDVCIGDHGPLSDTEWALASQTPLIELIVDEDASANIAGSNDPVEVTRAVLDRAPSSPYFAFIHLINPHPPYYRDAACGLRDVAPVFAAWGDGPEYRDAVTCLFDRLDATVQRILEVEADPVIIITGDHGPRLGFSTETSGRVLLDGEMFFSAFSAIRLPEACRDLEVADDLTFVNTFAVVLGCLTGTEPHLQPDRLFPILRDY